MAKGISNSLLGRVVKPQIIEHLAGRGHARAWFEEDPSVTPTATIAAVWSEKGEVMVHLVAPDGRSMSGWMMHYLLVQP